MKQQEMFSAIKGDFGEITLAVATQWHVFPEKFEWLAQHGFGMEYAPNPKRFDHTKDHLMPYVEKNIPVRHHGYFPGFEIGDVDGEKAEEALQLHLKAVDGMLGCGEQVMTVHVGLPTAKEVDPGRVKDNLARLVEYAQDRGVTICLENLRKGPTSNPETVLEWAEWSGASITMDIGHATSCKRVICGDMNVLDIMKMFSPLLKEVHFYETESTTHHAPEDMLILGPVVDQLLETDCRWWTIELDAYDEIINTRKLVQEYLLARVHSLAA